jgi:hypothetical protein
MPKEAREAALAQAQARDANRPAVELQAALDSENADDYVAKMVVPAKWEKDKWVPKTEQEIKAEIASIPESVKKKRRKAWSDARKTGMVGAEASTAEPTKAPTKAPTAPTATPAAAATPAQQAIDRIKAAQERNRQ